LSTRQPRREPAVAGMFYPSDPVELKSLIESLFIHKFGPGKLPPSGRPTRRIYGIVSPHAGYIYSGAVAANGFFEVSAINFRNVIMVGPNHYGIGSGVATMKGGTWETPLGQVQVNPQITDEISKRSAIVDFDDFAHSRDHCLEVQIPFLQTIKKQDFGIAPFILRLQDIDTATDLGNAIASACSGQIDRTLLVASSDFTHYEPNSLAHEKDGELIKTILALDIKKFYSVLERLDVTACGYGAIAAIMTAAKALGATKGELLRYATSGDITGDSGPVVGYASILFV